jgi:sodium-coupled neutral amino acid transporter 11
MAIRYFDGSYAVKGKFFTQLAPALQPSFNKRGGFSVNHLTFVLISMLSTSYIAHYNAPRFYNELKDTSMPRFNKVIGLAFGASIATFIIMMNLGFLTFGGATAGYVLNNYASGDGLASLARLAIGLALLTGYPFTFSALRDGILDLRKLEGAERAKQARPLTIGLITVITALAISLKNVGYVLSLSGALFGSTLMFCVPAYMNICAERTKEKASPGEKPSKNSKLEVAVNWGMIAPGFIMGAIGVTVSTLQELGKL